MIVEVDNIDIVMILQLGQSMMPYSTIGRTAKEL